MRQSDICGKQHLTCRVLCQQLGFQKPPHVNCPKTRLLPLELFLLTGLLRNLGVLLLWDLASWQFEPIYLSVYRRAQTTENIILV